MQQLGERLGRAWCSRSSSNSSRSSRSGSCSSFFSFFESIYYLIVTLLRHVGCLSYLSASGVTSLLAICEHAVSLLLLVLVSLLLLSLLLSLLLLLVVRCFSLLLVSKWCHVAACHLCAGGVTFYHEAVSQQVVSRRCQMLQLVIHAFKDN